MEKWRVLLISLFMLAAGFVSSAGAATEVKGDAYVDYAVGDFGGWHNYELSASLHYALTDQLIISPISMFSSGISSSAKEIITPKRPSH